MDWIYLAQSQGILARPCRNGNKFSGLAKSGEFLG